MLDLDALLSEMRQAEPESVVNFAPKEFGETEEDGTAWRVQGSYTTYHR